MNEPNFPTHELEQLLEKFREAHARADERANVTHERFNVFTTLLQDHDEVRLHTRFLHCLLDPKGCHDCQDRFLKLFFVTLKEEPGLDDNGKDYLDDFPQPDNSWVVEKEAARGIFGQIDILLEKHKFAIAIENKIYAAEGSGQLARYANYIEKQHGKENGLVLYLTLNGKRSMTHEGIIPYVRISYAKHILPWLDKCLRETFHIIPINQVLLQYRAVVLKLTGKNLDIEAMKEISEFITNHPDVIRFKDQILAGIVEARACFLDDLAVGIKKEFEDNNSGFRVKFLPNHNGQKFGENGNAQLIVTPPDNSELTKAPFKIFVEYDDGDYDGALLVGIVTETWFKWCCHPDTPNPSKEEFQAKMSDADQSLFGRMRKVLSEKGKDYSSNPIEPDNFHNWPIGWDCLIEGICDDEGLASLLKVSLAENIAKVCDGIRKHIELLEKVYKEAKAMQLNAIQP